MKKQLLGMLLTLAMLSGTVCGCSSGETGASAAPPGGEASAASAAESETASEPAEPVEIDIIARQLGQASHPDNAIWEALEPKLREHGVIANIEYYPSTDYASQCSALIASGQYPDMMEFWSSSFPRELNELIEDGVIQPLDDLIAQYGSNITTVRTENNCTWLKMDGQTYGIPCRAEDVGTNYCYVVRQDWLDALDLPVPDTLDDFYDMLVAFSQYDADGDGDTSDTIPFGYGSSTHFQLPVAIACSPNSIVYGQWNVTDDGVEYYAVMDNFKNVLEFTRRLYQEGLMEPEYVLMDRDQLWTRMNEGMYGACAWYVDRLDVQTSPTAETYYAANPDSQLTVLNIFPDENGVRRYPRMNSTQQMIVFSEASQEEAAACIRFLDYLYSDEGGLLADLGVEGVHWDTNEDGQMEILISSEEQTEAGYSMYNWMAKRSYLSPIVGDYSWEVADMLLASTVTNPVIGIETQAGEDYSSSLNSLTSTAITSMIVDEGIDLDQAFEEFVNSWYSSGGQEWTDQLNEGYQSQNQ